MCERGKKSDIHGILAPSLYDFFFVWGLQFSIFSLISFTFFDFASSIICLHFLALSHFSLVQLALASFFKLSNAFFPPLPLKAELVVVNGTPRADPDLTKPTTSHCLGTFYPILLLGAFLAGHVLLSVFWLATRPNMAPPSLNMGEINFSAPAICVGIKVSQLKVINLQSVRFQ